jgi:hypothetical protein
MLLKEIDKKVCKVLNSIPRMNVGNSILNDCPFAFFMEADLQAFLYNALLKEFPLKKSGNTIIHPIHMEYPSASYVYDGADYHLEKKYKHRHDIAILDTEQLQKLKLFEDPNERGLGYRYYQINAAIEIKYHWDIFSDVVKSSFETDIENIENSFKKFKSLKCGYVIVFNWLHSNDSKIRREYFKIPSELKKVPFKKNIFCLYVYMDENNAMKLKWLNK